jgi:hypothetical protein
MKDGIKTYFYYGNNSNNDNIPPEEFIWMISHCRNLTTSSFHGIAFGILFKRRTIISKDKINDARVVNLLNILGISHKNGIIDNYDGVDEKIFYERTRSHEWLEECVSINDFKYACYAKDKKTRDRSTSGGISAILAKSVID